jgi:hypothetical protein
VAIPSSNLGAAALARRARRLRAEWHDQPGRLHRKLRELAADSREIPVQTMVDSLPLRSGRAGAFADLTAESMDGDLLRYSARLGLLRQAALMGIERFEANLIIAAVQHRKASGPNSWRRVEPENSRNGAGRTALIIAIVQSAIIAGVWFALFR